MFRALAHTMYRRRGSVVGVWVVILLVAITQAAQVNSILGPGNFVLKGTDSERAATLLDQQFRQNDLKETLVVAHALAGTVNTPAFRRGAAHIVTAIRADTALRVDYLDNPLVTGNQQLISRDRHSVAILVSSALAEQDLENQIDHLRAIVKTPGFATYVTGSAATNHDYAVSTKDDLSRGESITVPILIVILLLVFGSLVASALPLLLAAFAITISLALVFIFGHYIDTSVYVTNVVTVLGLGIGIDYSLFIVYRFREELAAGNEVEAALVRTMATTGRAVFFSGLTVAIGLSSLLLTGVSFMQSMGLGGVLVPATALLVAMTLLPAVLGLLGHRINRFRVVPRRFLSTGESGMWHRMAMAIMRRPVLTGGIVLLILLALLFPASKLAIAYGGLKNAPKNLDSIAGVQYMQRNFPSVPNPIQVVIQHEGRGSLLNPADVSGMRLLEERLRQDTGVVRVIGPAEFLPRHGQPSAAQLRQLTGRYLSRDRQTAIISAIGKDDVGTRAADQTVRRLRDLTVPLATGLLRHDAVYVGGAQASYDDFNDVLYSHFPLIVAIVLLLTYVFLFYAFRSVFLPLKAVLLNLLSVLAAYGMLELVFQQGIGSGILAFSPEGGVAGWVPIFLFAFLFGLSMDYEVFLLSRVREAWLDTGKNEESVALGLEKTGRLITSAAAIMVVAFAGFLIGSQLQLKEFGFGLLAAIALDATLIRLVLVPAIMRLLGTINWWVPGFLHGFASQGATFGEGTVGADQPEMVEA
jgi:RND superfamily putative drug exporter